jgi:hypothetical protein
MTVLLTACLISTLLVLTTHGLALTGSTFPPRVYYSEGQNLTIGIFSDVRATGNETSVTFDAKPYFYPSNIPTKEVNVSLQGYPSLDPTLGISGTISYLNQLLPLITFGVGVYENRKFYVELRIYSGSVVKYGGVILEGLPNNTAPYVDGIKLESTYDGSLSLPQKVDASIFNAFVDSRDLYYNPSDPGIQTACVSCSGVSVLSSTGSCTTFANAKAGAFSLQGQTYTYPRCVAWVTDVDPNGLSPLSSPKYPISFIFVAKLTLTQRFIAWNRSIEGILFWLGVLFGITKIRGSIHEGSKSVAPETYLLCQRYGVSIWRFGYRDMHGKEHSSDLLPWVNQKNLCFSEKVQSMSRTSDVNQVMRVLLSEKTLIPYTGGWKYVMWCFRCRHYLSPTSDVQVSSHLGGDIELAS